MTPIRLIATDLDGTLLREDGGISPRTRAAIGAAQQAGLTVVFVTARPPRDVHAIAEHLDITGMAVCSNGAIVHDLATGETHRHVRLCSDLARALVAELRNAEPAITFAVEHGHKLGQEPGFPAFFAGTVHHHEPAVGHAHELCAEALTKLLIHHPGHEAEALAVILRAHVGDRAEVIWSGAPFVEIAPSGVSKAAGLAALCETLGIAAREVIAFGDMPNDLPMLAFAGRGVAVANAHRDVLAAADEITAANDADGVALIIETLLG
ncbi:MAG: HAD family hydrolase [Caulobacter sp.]|nr:HAD family hydrolase [Caulobacter sp.]